MAQIPGAMKIFHSALLLAGLFCPAAGHLREVKAGISKRDQIKPELHPKSDDKFFGGDGEVGDYPRDNRPVVMHHFDHPFPIVQESKEFDKDFVKDENSDGGEWKAQAQYDQLRNKLRKEQEDLKRALAKEVETEKRLKDAADALKRAQDAADAAGGSANDARSKAKVADDAADEAAHRKNGDGDAVDAAEKEEKKEEMDLEECLKKLGAAKDNVKKMKEDATKHKDELAKARVEGAEKKQAEAEAKLKAAEAALEYKLKKMQEDKAAGDADVANAKAGVDPAKAGVGAAKGKEDAAASAEADGERNAQGLKHKVDDQGARVEDKKRTYAQEKAKLEKMEADLKTAESELRGFRDVGHSGGVYRTKPAPPTPSGGAALAPSLLTAIVIACLRALV